MKDILKLVLNSKDVEVESLEEIYPYLSSIETQYMDYLLKCKSDLGVFPTEEVFKEKFPETTHILDTPVLNSSLEFLIKDFQDRRRKQEASRMLMDLASKVTEEGVKESDLDEINSLLTTSKASLATSVYSFDEYIQEYKETKDKPTGLLTYVEEVDSLIGGMNVGTMSVIMAYVASFKSVWGVNILYNNTYDLGYNVALISLEVPKEMVKDNILCRHSSSIKFSDYEFISHDEIRNRALSPEKEDYLFNVVAKDLVENSKGIMFILDETDFDNMTYSEIRNKLYQVDDICLERTGSGLDAVIVDYAQLLKYTDNGARGKSENAIINDYVSFFRRLTVKFRKTGEVDEEGNPLYRQIATVILAQANRQGYDKACKSKGKYSLMALSEANELERAAYRVFSIWTDDLLKESKEAMVCVLKNRGGRTCYDPQPVYADGETYTFGASELAGDPDIMDMSNGDLESMFDETDFGLY